MTEAQRNNISDEAISDEETTPQNGTGGARYCAICGRDAAVHGPPIERFGEAFCCEEHAGQFAEEVRAARVQATAALAGPTPESAARQSETSTAGAPRQWGWKRYLKLGACCGVPVLAVVLLAGGGGALLGAAGTFVPYLAALACPVGMYFMMRSMSKMGQKENPEDKREGK